MPRRNDRSGCFPWKFFSLILISILAYLLVEKHGILEAAGQHAGQLSVVKKAVFATVQCGKTSMKKDVKNNAVSAFDYSSQ